MAKVDQIGPWLLLSIRDEKGEDVRSLAGRLAHHSPLSHIAKLIDGIVHHLSYFKYTKKFNITWTLLPAAVRGSPRADSTFTLGVPCASPRFFYFPPTPLRTLDAN